MLEQDNTAGGFSSGLMGKSGGSGRSLQTEVIVGKEITHVPAKNSLTGGRSGMAFA
jgi:hypothetical protein